MLLSSTGPHHTVVGRQTKAAQLKSYPYHAVYIRVAFIAARTESSTLPCPVVYHCYTVSIAFGRNARGKKLALEIVMHW